MAASTRTVCWFWYHMGCGMIRHWWQSTFLFFALFALVACSSAAPDAESTSVEVLSTTPILLTSSPQPSATPFPTETASLTPTPQPSLTATSESTPTPQPTEVPATPTPSPEFGMRRQNPDTNQQEYWDGAQWRLPERFEPEPGTFIDVFPTGETVIITPEDQIASALESYNAFSIPGLGAINENADTRLTTEPIDIYTFNQGSYNDASISFKHIFLPVEAKQEHWILSFDGTSVEMPSIHLTVAYRHADGTIKYGTLVFSEAVQDGYGNLTYDFDVLMKKLQNQPKTLGVFIVTSNIEGRRSLFSDHYTNYLPYNEASVAGVLSAVDQGNFIFGDLNEGKNVSPTRVDMVN